MRPITARVEKNNITRETHGKQKRQANLTMLHFQQFEVFKVFLQEEHLTMTQGRPSHHFALLAEG